MSAKVEFTFEMRMRYLELVKLGRTTQEAARAAGVSHNTAMRWQREGKSDDGSPEAKEFAKACEEAKLNRVSMEKLTKADFDKIREEAVIGLRRLSMVQLKCMNELEGRFEQEAKKDAELQKPRSLADELAARRAQRAQ